jgi:hypothetical protein
MVQRVHHTVKEIFLENGKLNRFIVARIYSRKHLTNMRTAGKKSKRNKRWEEVVTSAMNSFEGGMVSDLHVGSSPSNTVTNALTWSLSPWVKTSIFSKYKRQKHVLDLPEFYDGNKKRRFIPRNKDK